MYGKRGSCMRTEPEIEHHCSLEAGPRRCHLGRLHHLHRGGPVVRDGTWVLLRMLRVRRNLHRGYLKCLPQALCGSQKALLVAFFALLSRSREI